MIIDINQGTGESGGGQEKEGQSGSPVTRGIAGSGVGFSL